MHDLDDACRLGPLSGLGQQTLAMVRDRRVAHLVLVHHAGQEIADLRQVRGQHRLGRRGRDQLGGGMGALAQLLLQIRARLVEVREHQQSQQRELGERDKQGGLVAQRELHRSAVVSRYAPMPR